MSWTRIPHPARNACCPWPEHCACARARLATRRERRPAAVAPRRPAIRPAVAQALGVTPPGNPAAPARPASAADLGDSGDSWERVLRRLAAEDAARRARARNPWYSNDELPAARPRRRS